MAAIGVQEDYILTIEGLMNGFIETRPLFWLHFASLFLLITLVFAALYQVDKKTASIISLALALVMPMLTIASNLFVLLTGASPFV